MNKKITEIQNHLMSGISNMIPYVIMGGIFSAFYIILNTAKINLNNTFLNSLSADILELGKISFTLMIPILAGYISFSIGGMSALTPAIVTGFYSDKLKLGMFGGVLVGFLCGYIAKSINKIDFPPQFKVLMPILIIPLFTVFFVSGIVKYLLSGPILIFIAALNDFLNTLSSQNTYILIVVLAMMIAMDMGGPINKAAYLFAYSLLKDGRSDIMGAVAVAICIPPISLGISTYIFRAKYNEMEKDVGKAAILMGIIGITEGAIPFAIMNPVKIVTSNIIGSIARALFAFSCGVRNIAPHGGFIVLPAIDNKLMYSISIAIGIFAQLIYLFFYDLKLKKLIFKKSKY